MDSPQYNKWIKIRYNFIQSFKPYYKWIVLNTEIEIDLDVFIEEF